MEWNDAKTQPPRPYQEVIICSDDDKVKSAIYLGNGKWNTFLDVELWMPFPDAPKRTKDVVDTKADVTVVEPAPKKKRGRPKKV